MATSRTLCDVAEGTPACACASVCALQLSALSNVVIFRLSLPLSLKTHVYHSNKKKKCKFKCRIFVLEDGNLTDRPLFVCVIVYFIKSMS